MRNYLLKAAVPVLAAVALACGPVPRAMARDDAAKKSTAAPAGKSVSPKGMILRREEPGHNWTPDTKWAVVGAGESLPADVLLVGLPGAEFDSADGSVHVRMLTDFDSPLPVLEPAVLLHPAGAKHDLDLTLDRGMIELVNTKKEGAASVRARVRDAVFDLTLYTPGTKVTLLLASAWPKGVPFKKDPGPKDVPAAELIIIAQKGDVDVRHDGRLTALSQPPGPAMIQWDNVHGFDASPTRMEKLPDWILPPTDQEQQDKGRRLDAAIAAFTKAVADQPLDAVLDKFLASENPTERHFAVILLGATDNLSRLAAVLNAAKHYDMWDAAVRALRHWIGRGPGQDQVVVKRLVELRGYKPSEAATVLHFLHTPDDAEMERPETYEMLIDHLASDRLSIRGLAFWHLYRLVPAGRKIAYDPLAPKEDRVRARAEWKKLIPDGQMPPKPTAPEQEKKP
jgi:hypothetical protein